MAIETKKLIFMKSNGVLVAMMDKDQSTDYIDTEKFQIKVVEMDNENGDYWHGDHDTGSVQSKSDKPVVNESTLKYNTNIKILQEYPIHKQLNIIIEMLDASDVPNTPEFTAMKAFIDAAKANLDEKITAYSTNSDAYTFVSTDDDKAQAEALKTFE
jgi:hypothetical protein